MTIKQQLIFLVLFFSFSACAPTKKMAQSQINQHTLNDEKSKKLNYYFYDAIKLKDEGKSDEALETLRMCYSIDSLDAGVLAEMGTLYNAIKMSDEALVCFQKAYALDNTNWWYGLELLSAYALQNKIDEATITAEELKTKFPIKEDIYQILGSLYKQSKNYDKAIETYNQLEIFSGISESLAIEKFNLYLQVNKPKKATAEIDKLVAKFPSNARYSVIRGDIYLQQNLAEKAFQIYQEVLQKEPENPYVYVSLSDYYNAVKKPEKATESIVKALKIEQLAVEQKIDILGQYVQKIIQDTVKLDETESLFKILIDRYPLEEQVHGYYAIFLQFRKRNTEAISEFESMLNINPKNEQTWLQLIQAYLGEQDFEQVLNVTERAIHELPNIPHWYFYRGIAQFQLKNYQDAIDTNNKAIALIKEVQNTLKSDIFAQIGDAQYKLNNKENAFEAYDEALKANPANIFVMNNYAYYLSEENIDLKKAEKMSAQTVEKDAKNSTYLDTYAWIFYKQGSYSLAKFYIERAVENLDKSQDPGVVLEHYGDILLKLGDIEKAVEIWEKAYKSGNKTEELLLKIETNKPKQTDEKN